MVCKQLRTKKYRTRDGPPFPANDPDCRGKEKEGNDNQMYRSVRASNGVYRWKKTSSEKKRSSKRTRSVRRSRSAQTSGVTAVQLKALKRKYKVTGLGDKKSMAEDLWQVRGSAMSTKDIEKLSGLLPAAEQKRVKKLLKAREDKPIKSYRGMWEAAPMAISKMTRPVLIRNLRAFRNAWEKITTRDMDLSDERLNDESTQELRRLIKFYYSDEGRMIAENWLRK